ncbi:hypothetical protein DPEC_G00155460 [Dallia pectoralis]|uniref:Uncharacterized protein n=1 Tax=Dallia pectoralis TaxID=75939 RepID=A0ACC2GKZ4_DALPE|nr:hypothetical protein DPEC_G00155460 [Dallia pectoralis]
MFPPNLIGPRWLDAILQQSKPAFSINPHSDVYGRVSDSQLGVCGGSDVPPACEVWRPSEQQASAWLVKRAAKTVPGQLRTTLFQRLQKESESLKTYAHYFDQTIINSEIDDTISY